MNDTKTQKPENSLKKSVKNAKAILAYGDPKRATDENAQDLLEGISEFSEIIRSEFEPNDKKTIVKVKKAK